MNNEGKKFTYQSLTIYLDDKVYEPAEDTFLLLESIDVLKKNSVFEIGSGTGIIALTCALKGSNVVCSDINPFAIGLIKKNIMVNHEKLNGSIDVRHGDLFNPLHVDEQFDVIVFNPPYLPTTKDQRIGGDGWYDKALDGGKSGMNVTIRFLSQVKKYLRSNGVVYIIYSNLSDRSLLTNYLSKQELKAEVINSLHFEHESIEVIKIS